jgi:hypothetical protein
VILWSSLHLVIFSGPKESMIFCFSIVGWLLIVFRSWNLIYLYLFGKSRHRSCSCIYCKWKFPLGALQQQSSLRQMECRDCVQQVLKIVGLGEACAWLLLRIMRSDRWSGRSTILCCTQRRAVAAVGFHDIQRSGMRNDTGEEKPFIENPSSHAR